MIPGHMEESETPAHECKKRIVLSSVEALGWLGFPEAKSAIQPQSRNHGIRQRGHPCLDIADDTRMIQRSPHQSATKPMPPDIGTNEQVLDLAGLRHVLANAHASQGLAGFVTRE